MASMRRTICSIGRILNSTASSTSTRNLSRTSHVLQSKYLYWQNNNWASSFSYSTQSSDVDLSTEESKRRLLNRLIYRSKQRGYLELDLVLGKWVEEHIHSMDEESIKSLVHVLDLENPDLWKWLSGQENPPEALNKNPVFSAIHEKVMTNLQNYSTPETRAIPGQPWVRGWDDIKKGRDGPITGNQ